MKRLFVCATPGECSRLVGEGGFFANAVSVLGAQQQTILPQLFRKNEEALLVTGIGMVNTGIGLGMVLANEKPELVINFGICGSFEGGPEMGEVVEVSEEIYPELGAENKADFLDLKDMGFANLTFSDDTTVFNTLRNPLLPIPELKSVKGLTVNKVHGDKESISQMIGRYDPEVETMEGAAVFHACMIAGIPFREFRAVSNRVEPRDRVKWKIIEAVDSIQSFIRLKFLSEA